MSEYDPEIQTLIDGPAAPVAQLSGAYDGASRFDRDLALWSPAIQSADLDMLPEKGEIDARVRDALRNDAYVASGQQLHKDNIVGAAFLLNSKPNIKVLGLSEAWATEFQEEVESKFTLYAESPRCWMDVSRRNTFTEMVRLAVGVYSAGGEIFASAEWIRDPSRPFKTALKMIELERISNPMGEMDSQFLRGGCALDKWGAELGFYVQTAHPRDISADQNAYQWRYIPKAKPWGRLQMIHIAEQMRPDQTRGVSQMVSALKEMRITKKFRDITLQSAVVNATYAASIESELPSEAVFAQLGGGNVGEAVSAYATSYLGAISEYTKSARNMHIDGARIPHFFPGTKLQMRNAGTPGGVGTDFEKSLLRYIAANLGVSYEQLSKDFSDANYSSIRAGISETWKYMQTRKALVADRFATQFYMLWLEEAINKGEIESLPRNAPSWYDGLNAEAYSQCEWIGASRGQIDELKETQAAVLRIKYNLSTYEDEHARLGKDWRKVFVQSERETKERKARSIFVEESNAINAASGAPREKERDNSKSAASLEVAAPALTEIHPTAEIE